MKTLLLAAMLMAFAIAAQAGEAKSSNDKEKASCCTQTKAVAQGKTCSAKEAKACCSTATTCKETPTKQALLSPKAAAEVTKKL